MTKERKRTYNVVDKDGDKYKIIITSTICCCPPPATCYPDKIRIEHEDVPEALHDEFEIPQEVTQIIEDLLTGFDRWDV